MQTTQSILLNVTVGAFLMWHLAIDRHFDFYIKYTHLYGLACQKCIILIQKSVLF